MFVLDASVAIAAILVEERTPEARTILRTALDRVIVPSLWHLEVGTILLRAERRGTIRADERSALRLTANGQRALAFCLVA